MILVALFENPVVVGILVAIPSSALGFLGYRRSRHNDLVAEQAGIATTQNTSIGQVIAGLDGLVANLQEDNKALREAWRENVKELNSKIDGLVAEVQDLKRQLAVREANSKMEPA